MSGRQNLCPSGHRGADRVRTSAGSQTSKAAEGHIDSKKGILRTPTARLVKSKGVLVVERSVCGVRYHTPIPLSEFTGVVASATEDETSGECRATLQLSHENPNYCVCLHTADNLDNIVAEWLLWSRQLGLPLFIKEAHGPLKKVGSAPNEVIIGNPAPRRKMASLTGRRPRFLVKRSSGNLELANTVHRSACAR
ncbi:hypothetical protein E1162_15410 [Rhodobacteraceae bacterium RKSG542]|uniref:DUF6101 family protein n=1 Tax=Pseudovibrio flavus TaxID=2529854 RepID=UPI0012BCC399|nr:DUF6101 family protein [Pseudovibrio flavus]MTI18631.1 hypothetical protein [Pseudovibrio flavus]